MKALKLATISASIIANTVYADIVVIANISNSINELSAKEVRMIYLGKRSELPNGKTVTAYDQKDDAESRSFFTKEVLRKSISSLNSYWSRQMFSGKATPPKQIDGSAQSIINAVKNNPNAIAYIDAKYLTSDVKPLLTISAQ